MTNFKPFALGAALRGEKVVTRDGREVKQLVYFENTGDKYPVIGVVDRNIENWKIDGSFGGDEDEDSMDLFMAPKRKTYWVNVYKFVNTGKYITINIFNSEDEAYRNRNIINEPLSCKYIKAISFEIEEE